VGPTGTALPGTRFGPADAVSASMRAFAGEITTAKARARDPQQRLMPELAWEALEEAGSSPRRLPEPTPAYASAR